LTDILLPEHKFGVLSEDKHSLCAAYSVSAVRRFADGDLPNRSIQPIQLLLLVSNMTETRRLTSWSISE